MLPVSSYRRKPAGDCGKNLVARLLECRMPGHQPMTRRRHPPAARERMLLEAAARLFAAKGYHGTSVNDVIAEAGGSKATLARCFGNKAGLFGAVIADFAGRIAGDISAAGATEDPRAGLEAIGLLLLRFYLDGPSLQAYRGVIATGPEEPAVAHRFYHQGHLRIVRAVSAALLRWRRAGLLRCPRPLQAADRYAHMLRHGPYERRLIGLRRTEVPAATLRRHVRETAEAFLHGSAPPTARRLPAVK